MFSQDKTVDGERLQDQLRITHLATTRHLCLILLLHLLPNTVSLRQDQLPLFQLERCFLISQRIMATQLHPAVQRESSEEVSQVDHRVVAVEKEVITRIEEISITIIKLRSLLLLKVVLDPLRLLDLIRRLLRRAVFRVELQCPKSPLPLLNNLNKIERPTLAPNLPNPLKPTTLNPFLALTLLLHRSLLFEALPSPLPLRPRNFLLPLTPLDLELKVPIPRPLPCIDSSTNNLNKQLLHSLDNPRSNLLVLRPLTLRIDQDLHHLGEFINLSRSTATKNRMMGSNRMGQQKRLLRSIRHRKQQRQSVGVQR